MYFTQFNFKTAFPNEISLLCCVVFLGLSGCNPVTPYCEGGVCVSNLHQKLNNEEIDHRLLFIGDTGAPAKSGEPVLLALEQRAKWLPDKTTIIFLGDNIYEGGMPSSDTQDWQEAKRRIDVQLDVLQKSRARGIFIPGNHDWDEGGSEGWERIKNLNRYIKTFAKDKYVRVYVLPEEGCPGPDTVLLGEMATVIILDTQWWLHDQIKPGPDSPSGCPNTTDQEVLNALKARILEGSESNRAVVIATHHPLKSNGAHAQYSDIKVHLFPFTDLHENLFFPLPVLGTLVAGLRTVRSPWTQDLSNPDYSYMRKKIQGILSEVAYTGHTPLVFAAGHEHHLEVIEGKEGARFHIISGAGSESKIRRVGYDERTTFAHSHTGFMELNFMKNGYIGLSVIEPQMNGQKYAVVFSMCLEKCENAR